MSVEKGGGSREQGAGRELREKKRPSTVNRQLPSLLTFDYRRFKNWYMLCLFSPKL
ncbi:hypothetical protein [Scytonema millei]|uniref:Uncharacterized protein n=1 Tax=Scytonema millei VB511283 TaxID=1245923 RepID=A0A9X5E3F7_9CYAN|nr:hypothetical protein [Scytonema millei]NHC34595.1 hypothetical protein [Scytonema millei VB511283]